MFNNAVSSGVNLFRETTFTPDNGDANLLVCMDGADASNVFTDEIATHTITPIGDAQVDNIIDAYGNTDGVVLLDGNGDGLSAPAHPDFQFDLNAFTVKCWVRFNSVSGTQVLVGSGGPGSVNYAGWKLVFEGNSGQLLWEYGSGGNPVLALARSWSPVVNTWYHVAVCRDSSSNLRMFVDGAVLGATLNDTQDYALNNGVQIGYHISGNEYANGWFDDVVVKKGVCDYTETFDVPIVSCNGKSFSFAVDAGGVEYLHVKTDASPVTVFLPAAADFQERTLYVVRHGSNIVTVNADNVETMNGQVGPQIIDGDNESLTIRNDITSASDLYIQVDELGIGDLLAANNLSDVVNAGTARTNLGVAIGSDVQAHSAVLDATTASFLVADETKLDGIETGADVTDAANVAAAGAPIISSGFGAPSSTPAAVGDIYVDTTGNNVWLATGTASSADWKKTIDEVFADNRYPRKIESTGDPSALFGGYGLCSIWTNTTTDESFVCVDDTPSSAIWKSITASSGLSSSDIDTLAELNAIVADATLIDTADSRLSDARTPTAHASDHTDGTDDIQDATASVKGLATAAQIAKLDGIETGADVTDAVNIAAAGAPIITSGAGAPSSTPAAVGDIYVDTTGDNVWQAAGTASSADWKQATGAGGGDLLAANNLSDLANAGTSRTNLGVAIGSDVQAHSAVLDATTASFTTADETKLDGIEALATADQTGAEIKTAYEAEADTNAYDDAAVTKLAGIEASATADQTSAEIKAAYEAEATHSLRLVLTDPSTYYSDIATYFPIWENLPFAITITKVRVTCDADPTTELTQDIKWADNLIGLANATLVVAANTSAGAVEVTTGWTDNTIAAGKTLYNSFGAAPDAAIKFISYQIEYTID